MGKFSVGLKLSEEFFCVRVCGEFSVGEILHEKNF